MKRIITLLSFAALITECIAQSCDPLDPGFGVNGKTLGLSTNNDWIYTGNILVQPDGKIIQASSLASGGIVVVRYANDGTPDNSFGINSRVTYYPGPGMNPQLSLCALQSDGKIVVVAKVNTGGNYYNSDILLARFNSDGSIDNSFGNGGQVVTVGYSNDEGNGLAIQPDGKIVVSGFTSATCFVDCAGYQFCMPSFTVLRYNSNGILDGPFGQGGKVVIPADSLHGGRALRVAIQPDGKIIAVGELVEYYCDSYYGGSYIASGFSMARFDSQGNFDSSFGVNGVVQETNGLTSPSALILQPDGKVVVAGNFSQGGSITRRYHNDGKPDNSFVSEVSSGWVNAATVNNDGKIILGGGSYNNSFQRIYITRLNSNGSPDSSFSGDGILHFSHDSPDSTNYISGLALQQGQIIVGGLAHVYNSTYGTYRLHQFAIRLKNPLDDFAVPISRSGPLYPCQGESVILSVHQPGSLQWYRDGQLIIGATDSVFNANYPGNYSVKVINAGKCGESAYAPVFFNSLPVTIIPKGGLHICSGDSVKLVSDEQGILQWFKDGFAINGATDTAYMARAEGYYSVGVKNSKGCGQSSPVFVVLNPEKPSIYWNGENLWTLSGYYNYQWYRNSQAIPGANGEIYYPADTGSFKVIIGDYGCNNTSDEYRIDCNTVGVPIPVISWDGSRLITSPAYESYQWYLNGNAVPGADTSFFQPAGFGNYKVVVTGSFTCSNTSEQFEFSCDVAQPSQPFVSWDGTKFISSTGYSTYQWYYNDTAIVGATTNIYTPGSTQFGNYKVVVTNNFNCSTTSDPKPYWITASGDLVLADASLRYYPNPVRTTLFVDVSMQPNRKMTGMLYDMSGKKLKQQVLKHGINQIQLEQLSSGLYQLEVQYGFERKVLKVIVLK